MVGPLGLNAHGVAVRPGLEKAEQLGGAGGELAERYALNYASTGVTWACMAAGKERGREQGLKEANRGIVLHCGRSVWIPNLRAADVKGGLDNDSGLALGDLIIWPSCPTGAQDVPVRCDPARIGGRLRSASDQMWWCCPTFEFRGAPPGSRPQRFARKLGPALYRRSTDAAQRRNRID